MRPKREPIRKQGQTYFVTLVTAGRIPFFRHDRWSNLMLSTLEHYRSTKYALHGFVIMPDHLHLLLSPVDSLEKAIQCIKGGFSFRAKKELQWSGEIWPTGFADHRIRDFADFERYRIYLEMNPVRKTLCERAANFKFSSAASPERMDCIPQRLKPFFARSGDGEAEAPPIQGELKH